jgi:small subunit ribosomal protein S18
MREHQSAKEQKESNRTPGKTKNVLQMNFIEASHQPQYVTDTGKILPRKYTGLSAKEQRRYTKLVKQGRNNLTAK